MDWLQQDKSEGQDTGETHKAINNGGKTQEVDVTEYIVQNICILAHDQNSELLSS